VTVNDTPRLVVESPCVRRARRPAARVRLVCFPHAGAGASAFAAWPGLLPPEIEVIAVQLPGREDRIGEPPLVSVPAAVRTAGAALRPFLTDPFVFFGHSVGALIAFELARELRARRRAGPAHLFLSAQTPPGTISPSPPLHALSDERFRTAIEDLGGMSGAVARDDDLMRVLLPALRADFELGENHRFQPGDPLSTSITAMGGRSDPLATPERLGAWRDHTTGPFELRTFAGGHFYLNDLTRAVTAAITEALAVGEHLEVCRGSR
jgi:surfactin synthase thioesterase subunit